MKKVSYWIVVLLSIGCSGGKDTLTPTVKPLIEAVYASGFVVSKSEYQAFSMVDGYLVDILVKDGEKVKNGQPIFIIESEQQNARFRIARETYELANKNSRDNSPVFIELRAAIESAKSKLQFDSVNFFRYANLLKSNAIKRADYDQAKLSYENSKSNYELQVSRLAKTKDQLALDLRNAENQLSINSEESSRYTVRSKVDGVVYKTLKEKGELVRRTEALAVVGEEDFYLQLSVDELDLQKTKPGQEVLVKIDAFGDKAFKARVTKVHPLVNTREQSVRVDADFIDLLPNGFTGLAVEANIIIQQKAKAMVIPKSVLLEGDSVLVKTENGKKKVKIIRGIETLDEVEVLEGINESTQLIAKR
ncbi:MAG: efflux RND transporter periplasmic adaptor subunit [Bacteroidetes bacterium]|nr:efflux RND transporter periplasmic adaptor subunit [Bacteroidota bacterium]